MIAPTDLHIDRLDHRDAAVAQQIHAVWVPAYEQEARLLRAAAFPPLQRQPADIAASHELFVGAWTGGTLAAVLSLGPDEEGGQIQITALVVDPAWQRQGLARALVKDALSRCAGMAVSVATGAANTPALTLYQGLGFAIYRRGELGDERLPVVKLRRAPDAR